MAPFDRPCYLPGHAQPDPQRCNGSSSQGEVKPCTPPAYSPKCVEGKFCEVRLEGVLGSQCWPLPRVPWGLAKIFGLAKPLLLREAIASPSNKPWSRHNASACG